MQKNSQHMKFIFFKKYNSIQKLICFSIIRLNFLFFAFYISYLFEYKPGLALKNQPNKTYLKNQ